MNDISIEYIYSKKDPFPHWVKLVPILSVNFYYKINEWMKENIKGLWVDAFDCGNYYIRFKLKSDAVAFKLRWL